MVIKLSTATYENCKQEFIAFKNANRDAERDERHFDWRYLKRPCELKPIIVWAENGDGKKVGALSVVPHHYSINNKVYPLGILGDISVAKEYRGKGIAKQMFNYLSGLDEIKKLKACIVLPNEDAARPLEKTGWHTAAKLERYVKILDVEERLNKYLKSETLSRVFAFPFNSLLKLLSYESFLKESSELKSEIVSGFDDRFDVLWDEVNKENKEGMVIGNRNREYLTWRYKSHPNIKHEIFALLHNNALCGYIVYHNIAKICYIVDILFLNKQKYCDCLLYYFINYIKKNNISFSIQINVNNSDLIVPALRRFRFLRRPDCLRFMINNCDNDYKWFLTAGDKDV